MDSKRYKTGWLIVSERALVFICRSDGTVSKVEGFDKKLSGEDVLRGLEFDSSVLLYVFPGHERL